MLTQIVVNNFAIAEHVEQSFQKGTTIITGETGAGKSLLLDALNMALGNRADAGIVRHGTKRAEVSATFDVSLLSEARNWLVLQDLDQGNECIMRRIITSEGRSRGYINGQPCSIQNLRDLGEMLIDLHGQHEHQSLMRKENHLKLIDEFGQLQNQKAQTRQWHKQLTDLKKELKQIEQQDAQQSSRRELLSYQVRELDQLALYEGEIEPLEREQLLLSQAEQILQNCQQVLTLNDEGDINSQGLIDQSLQYLSQIQGNFPALEEAQSLLEGARIQVEEASQSIRRFCDHIELNPTKLQEVEDRLSAIYQLSRKHKTSPEKLFQHYKDITLALKTIDTETEHAEKLRHDIALIKNNYYESAIALSKAREKTARLLDKNIAEQLRNLHMPSIVFKTKQTRLDENQANIAGIDEMEFLVSTNAGQPPRPLTKVASGGELSRISLAIQVVTAEQSPTPTLVFDEVDVGIGGATAEVVGHLLRKLGDEGQVICVTHQAQVAIYGHQHLRVSKQSEIKKAQSQIETLDNNDRVLEIARMIGGIQITEQTKAHASEMLESVATSAPS